MEAQPLLAVVDHKPAPGTALPCCCCRRVRCCWCCCRIPRWGCVLLSIAAVLCVLATAATCVYFLVIHKHVPEYFPPSGPCPRACACRLRAPCFRGPHVCWTCGCGCFYVLAMCVCACACVCVWLCVAVCGCVWRGRSIVPSSGATACVPVPTRSGAISGARWCATFT